MQAPHICRICALAAGWHMPPVAFNGQRLRCGVCGHWRNVVDTELLGNDRDPNPQ